MAPRSTSAKPSQAPLTMRSTRSQSRRGTSTQPASPMACSSTTANRVQKAGKTPSIASQARTRRAASVVSTVTTAPAKPLQKLLTTQSVAIAPRSGYGDAHANREYMGMLEYAKAAHKAGIVDEETLEKMCIPWQEKGVLEMNWKEEYLLDGVKEVEEIMDLKKAEAIARKKDAAEKKFLEEHFGGAGKVEKKKEPLKSVRSGKISKKTSAPFPNQLQLWLVQDQYSPFLGTLIMLPMGISNSSHCALSATCSRAGTYTLFDPASSKMT